MLVKSPIRPASDGHEFNARPERALLFIVHPKLSDDAQPPPETGSEFNGQSDRRRRRNVQPINLLQAADLQDREKAFSVI